MTAHWQEIWHFDTAEYRVVCAVTSCEDDPADDFTDNETLIDIRDGRLDWFDVRVQVLRRVRSPGVVERFMVLGWDYLGHCAYYSAADFAHGVNRSGYFRDMVRTAVDQARDTLKQLNAA